MITRRQTLVGAAAMAAAPAAFLELNTGIPDVAGLETESLERLFDWISNHGSVPSGRIISLAEMLKGARRQILDAGLLASRPRQMSTSAAAIEAAHRG